MQATICLGEYPDISFAFYLEGLSGAVRMDEVFIGQEAECCGM